MPPLFSVITPCYNAAPFVTETMESVLAQTFSDLEHIVVDDGSTDGADRIIADYAARHPNRIRAELLPHTNGNRARNRGAELAQGRYLLFLDADDLIPPNFLETFQSVLGGERDKLAFCPWIKLEPRGSNWEAQPPEPEVYVPDGDCLKAMLTRSWCAVPCACIWPRELYQRTGGWDESLLANQDKDILFRALMIEPRTIFVSGVHAIYRRHGPNHLSVSANYHDPHIFRSRVRVNDKIVETLRSHGMLGEYAISVARVYHRMSLHHAEAEFGLAAECDRRALALAGYEAIPDQGLRRLTHRLLGFKGKHRLKKALASLGLSDEARMRLMRLLRKTNSHI